MLLSPQDLPEERGAGGEDDLVGRDLLVRVAGQGHVEEIGVIFQFSECSTNVLFKIIPLQAKLFICHFLYAIFCVPNECNFSFQNQEIRSAKSRISQPCPRYASFVMMIDRYIEESRAILAMKVLLCRI